MGLLPDERPRSAIWAVIAVIAVTGGPPQGAPRRGSAGRAVPPARCGSFVRAVRAVHPVLTPGSWPKAGAIGRRRRLRRDLRRLQRGRHPEQAQGAHPDEPRADLRRANAAGPHPPRRRPGRRPSCPACRWPVHGMLMGPAPAAGECDDQYAKPRSRLTEVVHGQEYPTYRCAAEQQRRPDGRL